MSTKTTKTKNNTVNANETVATRSKGRPTVEGSARQARLAARAARVAAGGEVKRGRPTVVNSARQTKLNARAEALANGVAIKRGRPKMEKPAVETAVEAVVE